MSKGSYLDEQEKALGIRIKKLRIERGFNTQYEFTKAYTGESKRSSFISKVEHGANIDFITIVRLIRTLKISTLSLFDFNNQFPIQIISNNLSLEESIQTELHNLSKRIYVLRKAKKLVQLNVALEALIGDTKISAVERGEVKPEFDTIASIALGLKVQIWELFDYSEQ